MNIEDFVLKRGLVLAFPGTEWQYANAVVEYAIMIEMKLERVEAKNARLRAALEQMEWIENDMGAYHCPWCYGDEPNHEAECPYKAVMRDEA